ncbi:MAG: guanine deaminase, partial [Thiovulaceae bacterium]|nr:guanine deaminase [Sulfurimonadaceae bacterium]
MLPNSKNPIQDCSTAEVFRASILFFNADPSRAVAVGDAVEYYEDGLLIVEHGHIKAVGDYEEICKEYNVKSENINAAYSSHLIMPGFVDTHIHYPQTEMIASYGEQLLTWLVKYTFPTEKKFKEPSYCKQIAEFFIDELLKNGTTTALVLGTVHVESAEALFTAADQKEMRLIAGKVMMNRNAPDALLDTAQSSYDESEALIKKWHRHNRLLYAITPRFAATSTRQQLTLAGDLKKRYPSTYLHTHLAESTEEVAWVKSLFPEADNYLDVYDRAGLVTSKSIFAHAVHLEEQEYALLHKNDAAVSFCPTSNLFLGSGLFKMREMKRADRTVRIGLGTDVGAGTSFSMLQTLNEAYKVVSLEQNAAQPRLAMSAFEGFYQATLGGANALSLDEKIGKLAKGYEADFVVLDFEATALQK